MTRGRGGPLERDPRAVALAQYLRGWATSFSLSADTTDSHRTAMAGMALLDAAQVAESMAAQDPRLQALSEAGLFESMPNGRAHVVEIPEIKAAVQRPIAGERQDAAAILELLVATALALDDIPGEPDS